MPKDPAAQDRELQAMFAERTASVIEVQPKRHQDAKPPPPPSLIFRSSVIIQCRLHAGVSRHVCHGQVSTIIISLSLANTSSAGPQVPS